MPEISPRRLEPRRPSNKNVVALFQQSADVRVSSYSPARIASIALLYPTCGRTRHIARTFLRLGAPRILRFLLCGISCTVSGWENFAGLPTQCPALPGTHNITECALIEREDCESRCFLAVKLKPLYAKRHIDAAESLPGAGVHQDCAERNCSRPFRRRVKVEESAGLCAISDDTLRHRLLKHCLRGQADIDIVGIRISPVRTKTLISVAFYLIRRNVAVAAIIRRDEHKVVVPHRQRTPTAIFDRNSERN